uniref:Uncharacterized protein n=1 Tax=Rhizophora mucronata TaxID=61149 RepID=A0A2P2PYA2_RHIMU
MVTTIRASCIFSDIVYHIACSNLQPFKNSLL